MPCALRRSLCCDACRGPPACADVLTQQAVEFIGQAEADDRPFFLYLAPCECLA